MKRPDFVGAFFYGLPYLLGIKKAPSLLTRCFLAVVNYS